MPLPSGEGCGLAWSYLIGGYGRKNTRGDPSGRPNWCLVCHKNGPWLMAHSHSSLFSGPQLMPFPPPSMLAVLTQPRTPRYKQDKNRPTLCHGEDDDHMPQQSGKHQLARHHILVHMPFWWHKRPQWQMTMVVISPGEVTTIHSLHPSIQCAMSSSSTPC